ncbi:MAG TPA: hypothetical protein VG733_12520 [Chthoniobacteraceae bacterium]|nr:hypothetical protein [Chthoniobacteraceae bacterium]
MNKATSSLLALIIAGSASYFYLKQPAPLGDMKASGFVPEDTIALIELPDMQRSGSRWQATAINKIMQEPEVAAFLNKPESMIPPGKALDRLAEFRKLAPKEVFIAVVGQNNNGPKIVIGFDYSGNRKDAESLLGELKFDFAANFPEGKSDVEQYGQDSIETFRMGPGESIGTVFSGQWFFMSNDIASLHATIDLEEGKPDAPKTSLHDSATYNLCLSKMPADPDAVIYVDMKDLGNSVATMLETTQENSKAADEFKKIKAYSWAMKFDGENMRDAFYTYRPGGEAHQPLVFNSKAYSSPDSILYYAMSPHMTETPMIPGEVWSQLGVGSTVTVVEQALKQAGLSFDDFKTAFGPEAGLVVNWGENAPVASGVLSVDVQDAAKARKFLEAVSPDAAKKEVDGVTYYTLKDTGLGLMRFDSTVALTGKNLVFGIDADTVKAALQAAASNDAARIDKSDAFKTASGLVGKPTDAFAYVDSRTLFDRTYGLSSDALKMAAMLNSSMNEYADFSKLPPPGVISKHLGPIVYSQSTDENGTLCESAGPITFTEAMLGVGIGGVYYSTMQIRQPAQPVPARQHLSKAQPAP